MKELLDRISELERENERLKGAGKREETLKLEIAELEKQVERAGIIIGRFYTMSVKLGYLNEAFSSLENAVRAAKDDIGLKVIWENDKPLASKEHQERRAAALRKMTENLIKETPYIGRERDARDLCDFLLDEIGF